MVESLQRIPYTQIETYYDALVENQKKVKELIEFKENKVVDVSEVESNFRFPLVQMHEIVQSIIEENKVI
jgi:hypothetical protein